MNQNKHLPVYRKTLNLMPHDNVKSQSDTSCHTWFERDRAHVELRNKKNDISILEFWDEQVSEAIQDGYLNIKKPHESMYDHAKQIGLI